MTVDNRPTHDDRTECLGDRDSREEFVRDRLCGAVRMVLPSGRLGRPGGRPDSGDVRGLLGLGPPHSRRCLATDVALRDRPEPLAQAEAGRAAIRSGRPGRAGRRRPFRGAAGRGAGIPRRRRAGGPRAARRPPRGVHPAFLARVRLRRDRCDPGRVGRPGALAVLRRPPSAPRETCGLEPAIGTGPRRTNMRDETIPDDLAPRPDAARSEAARDRSASGPRGPARPLPGHRLRDTSRGADGRPAPAVRLARPRGGRGRGRPADRRDHAAHPARVGGRRQPLAGRAERGDQGRGLPYRLRCCAAPKAPGARRPGTSATAAGARRSASTTSRTPS